MPISNFICPDGGRQPKIECLAGKCRMESRCAPLTYLELAGRERKWEGVPSVTQLIDGTRRQYLLLTTDYDIDPDQAAYRVLGTKGHTALDSENDFSFTEEHFDDGEIMGTADMVEQQPDGSWMMIDHKTAGSYKVAKALGIVKEETIVYDVDGTPKKHKNGRVVKDRMFVMRPEAVDVEEWILQTNMYRIKFEEKLGEKIPAIKIFSIVRDGGTFTAKGRGVFRNTYYVKIPVREDAEILAYFKTKRDALLSALEAKKVPEQCSPVECWNGRKCDICEVRAACALHGRTYQQEAEDE